jgi:hypothetical protein
MLQRSILARQSSIALPSVPQADFPAKSIIKLQQSRRAGKVEVHPRFAAHPDTGPNLQTGQGIYAPFYPADRTSDIETNAGRGTASLCSGLRILRQVLAQAD